MKIINGKNYKKIDPHLHISPVSVCARMDAEAAAERYAKCGFDGVVLTNHYSRSYIDVYSAAEREWRELFLENFYAFREAAAKYNLEVFLGAEVTLQAFYIPLYRKWWAEEFIEANFADYLLYGVTEEFLRKTPMLCDLTIKELRAECDQYNILLVQAHPFRVEQQHSLKNLEYVDGLEINGNENFPSGPHEEEILRIARERNLIVTCGGDTHDTGVHLRSATFVPEEIHDAVALAAYLKKVKIPHYSLSEPDPFAPSK